MAHEVEGHGIVTLEPRPKDTFGYARHVWAVVVEGRQHGWIVRPNGIGAAHEAWSMHATPHHRGTVGRTGLLARAPVGTMPEEGRKGLAERFAAILATGNGKQRLPTKEELDALRPPRAAPSRRPARDISMQAALGGIRVSEPRVPRVDEEGKPMPGIGYIP